MYGASQFCQVSDGNKIVNNQLTKAEGGGFIYCDYPHFM